MHTSEAIPGTILETDKMGSSTTQTISFGWKWDGGLLQKAWDSTIATWN
jgi:hypothetical protein